MANETMAPSCSAEPIDRLVGPIRRFLNIQAAGGVVLMACAAAAMYLANSRFAEGYQHLLHTPIGLAVGGWSISHSLSHWINDGLMAVFFFLVGLEIKREALAGELASPSRAALPVIAAVGGMVAPASIYAALNAGLPGAPGFGIPMATDIAFVIGALSLMGRRAPAGLKLFLTAVAIADDLGAVVVIAVFYTAQLHLPLLAASAALLAAMALMNRLGVRHPMPYLAAGVGLWFLVFESGVHATVAGVLAAMTIPARNRLRRDAFLTSAQDLLEDFRRAVSASRPAASASSLPALANPQRQHALEALRDACVNASPPLLRIEHGLHPWVSFVIMPIFALANAGVELPAGMAAALLRPVSLGVILGLALGKPLGIFGCVALAQRLGLCLRPGGVSWAQLFAGGCLGGIGFTMSMFIANLAFVNDAALVDAAKLGIILGSMLSWALGAALLLAARPEPAHEG